MPRGRRVSADGRMALGDLIQVRRLEREKKKINARFAVHAPRSTHQSPILVHAVFSEWENALVKRLRKISLSGRPNFSNNVEHTHIFHESRARVTPRRRKVDRRGKRVVRDSHWDTRKCWGNRGGHLSSYIRPGRTFERGF